MRQTETRDPDVPKLRTLLRALQQDVRAGRTTPLHANATLGKIAESLARRGRKVRRGHR